MKKHNEIVTFDIRYFNLQRVDFDETGYPIMSLPTGYEVDLTPPAGEID